MLAKASAPVIVVRMDLGCNPNVVGGVMGIRRTAAGGWDNVFSSGPFGDCAPNDFSDPRNFRSIRAADIDGDGIDEFIGRGPGGILAYSWNGKTSKWSQIVNNVPALSDGLWARDPAYRSTIRTARVDGRKAALLARGTAGIRTWLYNGATFARPKPYGSFPVLDQASYSAINNFLNLPHGVRASYANGTSTCLLEQYISSLRDICHTETSANPPQFKSCDPPRSLLRGPRPAPVVSVFTATVDQLLRELYYVIASNGWPVETEVLAQSSNGRDVVERLVNTMREFGPNYSGEI